MGPQRRAANRAEAAGLFNLVLGKTTTLTALAAKTFTPGSKGNDYAAGFDFAYQHDHYNYGVTYLDVGDNFNAEMGYIKRTDVRNPRVRGAWTPRPKWPGVRQLTIGGQLDTYMNHAGSLVSRTGDGQFIAAFNDTSTLTVDVLHDDDHLSAPWQLGNGIVPVGAYTWNTVSASYLSNSSLPAVPAYVTNTVSTRVSYSFSPSLFAKGFIQYNDAKKQATINLLLWYIYRPGSDLYIVYNQGWDTDLPGPHFMQVRNKSLSVKMTYWIAR